MVILGITTSDSRPANANLRIRNLLSNRVNIGVVVIVRGGRKKAMKDRERSNLIGEIHLGLRPLFVQAVDEGLNFVSGCYGIEFKPARLALAQARGQYLWGACNWKLVDPKTKEWRGGNVKLDHRYKGKNMELLDAN